MKNVITTVIGCLLVCTTAYARQLSPAEALNAAMTAKGGMMKVRAQYEAQPVITMEEDGMNTVYVFNGAGLNDGYIIASADDVAVPRLGFSDSGKIDADNMPPQLKWLLNEYSSEIAAATMNGYVGKRYAPPRMQRATIAPLVPTLWNQSAPYNDECPMVKSSSGSMQRTVTGCVATAMAQVMKTHNWPETGTGTHSYSFAYGDSTYHQSMNFGDVTFDWENMLNTYSSSATAEQKAAVAELMHACGVSVSMNYGLAATGGSGAVSFNAARALVNNFGYSDGIEYKDRQYYDISEWTEIIYDELAAGRPVIFAGQSGTGGHEFICDGYTTGDYFHFNWGWGGTSNGYFQLTALDPTTQGIGGSNSGYNISTSIITGICKPTGRSAFIPTMVLQGQFLPENESYEQGDGESVVFGQPGYTLFRSSSIKPFEVSLGLKLTDMDGTERYISSTDQHSSAIPANSGWYQIIVPADSFPEGSYKVTPAFNSNGTWYDIRIPVNYGQYATANVADGMIDFSVPSTEAHISVVSYTQETPVYVGQPAEFDIEIQATGDFYGEIIPAIISGGNIIADGSPKGISLDAGQTMKIEWVTEINSLSQVSSLSPGDYEIVFIGVQGESYSDEYPITIKATQDETPTVEVKSVTFNNASGDGTENNPYIVNPGNASVTIALSGTEGYWTDNVMGMLFDMTTGQEASVIGSDFVGIEDGQTRNITLTGNVSGVKNEVEYIFLPWGNTHGQMTQKFTYVVFSSTTDTPAVAAPQEPISTCYYTMTGIMAGSDSSKLAPGYYICQKSYADGAMTEAKLLIH